MGRRQGAMVAGKEKPTEETADRALVIARVFGVPRQRGFKAWIEQERVTKWWGPHGFTTPVCELDVRPGGAIHMHMREPDGTVHSMTGVYREIAEPERLVFTCVVPDEKGETLFEVLNTVTFAEQGNKTMLTLQARVVKKIAGADRYLAGMEAGWTQSLERLEAYVAKA